MLSQYLIAYIDYRLREATGNKTNYFGGLSIILLGDPGQLLPVGGTPLYFSNKNIFDSVLIQGFRCYQQFKHAVKLDVCIRQQNLGTIKYKNNFR